MKLPYLALLFALVAFFSPAQSAAADSLPNIILLMGDDHGWDEVGYNGHPHIQTPVLDEMSKQGAVFHRFYAHPSCSPTRGSILTGRHPNRYGTFVPGRSIRPEEISIGQIMQKAGYATAHFGKWHVGTVKKGSPLNPGAMGFDEWLGHDNFFELNPVLSRNGNPPEKIEGESSQILIDETKRFIQQAGEQQKPFFIQVWFGSPHEPYAALPEDLALYNDLPEEWAKKTTRLTSLETGKQIKRPFRDVLQERYAEITAMDRAIGDLRVFLKQNGLKPNTLIWYYGDNGVPRSGHLVTTLRSRKGTVYEGGIRVPSVLEWPAAIPENQGITANAIVSDMLATLCELTGQPLPDRPLDSISLVPMISGKQTQRPTPLFFWNFNVKRIRDRETEPYLDPSLQQGTTPLVKRNSQGTFTRSFKNYHYRETQPGDETGSRAIILNQYKLVVKDGNPKKPGSVELFDLHQDPLEQHPITDAPDTIEDLTNRLQTWQASVLNSLTGADY